MNFEGLAQKHKGKGKTSINALYKHYVSRKADSLTDAMSAALGISAIFKEGSIDLGAVTPAMKEAFEMSFPQLSFEDLNAMSAEQLTGIISNWKGKLFEVEVRNQLNNGELVGNISLGEGQVAELAESLNQPGWDVQILNSDGSIAEFLQLKATNSMSYISEALAKYPDIDIVSTSEVANFSAQLVDSGISNEQLTEPLVGLLEGGESMLDMILPGLPFLIIAVSEGRKVFANKMSIATAYENAIQRGVKTGLSMTAGWLVFDVTGIGWLAIFATVGLRGLLDYLERDDKIVEMIPIVENYKRDLLLLKASYT